MRISIKSPPYHSGSGGIRVLHYLGYLLTELGHTVDMCCTGHTNPEWGHYNVQLDNVHDFCVLPESYPQTLKEPGPIVRWVLYFPGHIGAGPGRYPDDEMVVSFHDDYDRAAQVAAPGRRIYKLHLPAANMDGLTSEPAPPRDVRALLWVGKGERPQHCAELVGVDEITRGWPAPRDVFIRYLRRTQTLYTCDPNTAVNAEAQLCGCRVLLRSGGQWIDWRHENPHEIVMNKTKQLEQVRAFVEQVKQHFNL